MADQGYPPVPPVNPQADAQNTPAPAPTPAYAAPGYAAQPPQAPPAPNEAYAPVPPVTPPRKSRAWMWWTFGMLALVAIIVGSCTLPLYFLGKDTGSFDSISGDAIAVIHISGVIAGTGDTLAGDVTPEYFLDQMDQAAEDDSVKAILLRVDSPGGTVAASEEISAYVKASKKPVVVSIGDIGASGAYMVSSQADEIIAMPGSAVGSIGVISEIPNVSKLLGKVGVEFQVITAGKNKDTGSPFRPLTKEERNLIQGEVDEAYDQFIDIVASGRKMERSKVESLATGWVWSGAKAKELGLIDTIGTYDDALEAAAKRGGIEGDYEIVTYEEELGELFGSLLGIQESLQLLSGEAATRESAVRRSVPR